MRINRRGCYLLESLEHADLHRHSREVARAPHMAIAASPAQKTTAAQITAPSSSADLAGHVQGNCQPELIAFSARAK